MSLEPPSQTCCEGISEIDRKRSTGAPSCLFLCVMNWAVWPADQGLIEL